MVFVLKEDEKNVNNSLIPEFFGKGKKEY